MTVWIVEQCYPYDGCFFEAVFLDEKEAQKYIDHFNSIEGCKQRSWEIQAVELQEVFIPPIRKTK